MSAKVGPKPAPPNQSRPPPALLELPAAHCVPRKACAASVLRNAASELWHGAVVGAVCLPVVVLLAWGASKARSELRAEQGLAAVRYPDADVDHDAEGWARGWTVPFIAVNALLTMGFASVVYLHLVPLNVSTTAVQRRWAALYVGVAGFSQAVLLALPLSREAANVAVFVAMVTCIFLLERALLLKGSSADADKIRAYGRRIIFAYMLLAAVGSNFITPLLLADGVEPGTRLWFILLAQPLLLDAVHVLHRTVEVRFGTVRGNVEISAYAHGYLAVVRRLALFGLGGGHRTAAILLIPAVEWLSRASLLHRERLYLALLWRSRERARAATESARARLSAVAFSMFSETSETSAIVTAAAMVLALRFSTSRAPPDAAAVLASAGLQLALDAVVETLPRMALMAAVPPQPEAQFEVMSPAWVSQTVYERVLLARSLAQRLDWRIVSLKMVIGILFVASWAVRPLEGDVSVLCGWGERGGWWSTVRCSDSREWLGL